MAVSPNYYLNCCGKKSLILPSSPKSRFSNWMDKNSDILHVVGAIVAAVLATLFAKNIFSSPKIPPLFLSGSFAVFSAFFLMNAIIIALKQRGCITIEKEHLGSI